MSQIASTPRFFTLVTFTGSSLDKNNLPLSLKGGGGSEYAENSSSSPSSAPAVAALPPYEVGSIAWELNRLKQQCDQQENYMDLLVHDIRMSAKTIKEQRKKIRSLVDENSKLRKKLRKKDYPTSSNKKG